jgi:paraquat-inducible protein A
MSIKAASKMVCHECDLLIDVPELDVGQKAYCPRCNYHLAANRPHAFSMMFAFSVTAILFLILATGFPFLGFSAGGQERTVTLLQSISILLVDMPPMAAIVFSSIIFIPATFLLGIIYVMSALARQKLLPATVLVLRWSLKLVPWSMAEIFLIGVLVSFVKIVSIADVSLGLSFWSYTLFTVCVAVVILYLDKRECWERIRALDNA